MRRTLRVTLAFGSESPSGNSDSTRSSDSTVRANPFGVQFDWIGWTIERSTQITLYARR
jgi:hypothetical protein